MGLLGYLGAVVKTREPHLGKWWAGEANVRVPVRTFPQEAPDPSRMGGAYGEIPTRPAMVQVVTFSHDMEASVSQGSFVAVVLPPAPRAQVPRGRQLPFAQRTNIRVPPYVAYGSLFTS